MTNILGLHVTKTPKKVTGNLYAWCRPDGGIVYIGKSESPNRIANELGWVDQAKPCLRYGTWAAFSTVMARHQAEPIMLHYDANKSDLEAAKNRAREDWELDPEDPILKKMMDMLLTYQGQLTVSEVEKVLIRMPLTTGNFTANSADTGLWNNKNSSFWDFLAQFAAIEADYRDF